MQIDVGALKAIPWLRNESDAVLQEIATAETTKRDFPRQGHPLFQAGMNYSYFYIVEEGALHVVGGDNSADSKQIHIRFVVPYMQAGFGPCVTGLKHHSTFIAFTKHVQCVRVEKDTILRALRISLSHNLHDNLVLKFYASMMQRFSQYQMLTEWEKNLNTKDNPNHKTATVARFLYEAYLAVNLSKGGSEPIYLTQKQVAEHLGTTLDALNSGANPFTSLQHEKLIVVGSGRIAVTDPEGLKQKSLEGSMKRYPSDSVPFVETNSSV